MVRKRERVGSGKRLHKKVFIELRKTKAMLREVRKQVLEQYTADVRESAKRVEERRVKNRERGKKHR